MGLYYMCCQALYIFEWWSVSTRSERSRVNEAVLCHVDDSVHISEHVRYLDVHKHNRRVLSLGLF